jgi:hypothetical protein
MRPSASPAGFFMAFSGYFEKPRISRDSRDLAPKNP